MSRRWRSSSSASSWGSTACGCGTGTCSSASPRRSLGWENPLRLAEDLATVDILSGGRLNPGVSVGPPMHYDRVRQALYPDTADLEDFSYDRVERLLGFVRGKPASDFSGTEGFEVFSDRVQPHAAGLAGLRGYPARAHQDVPCPSS
jgi:hypothetical protein